jgi:hypothetical protein
MKQINVSNECAKHIESLRDAKLNSYEGELENCLEVIKGLNGLIDMGRDSADMAKFADDAQRAIGLTIDYYTIIHLLRYECDFKEDGRVMVSQMSHTLTT